MSPYSEPHETIYHFLQSFILILPIVNINTIQLILKEMYISDFLNYTDGIIIVV